MPKRLEDSKRKEIAKLLASGETQKEVAAIAGVAESTVARVAKLATKKKAAKKKRRGARVARPSAVALADGGDRAAVIATAVGSCMDALRAVPFDDHSIVVALATKWLAGA